MQTLHKQLRMCVERPCRLLSFDRRVPGIDASEHTALWFGIAAEQIRALALYLLALH